MMSFVNRRPAGGASR